MALSPSYPRPTKALVSEVFLCLAHNESTHHFLAKDFLMSGMLRILSEEATDVDTTPNGIIGLRYITLVL